MKKRWITKKTDGGGHVFIMGMLSFALLLIILLYVYWNMVANTSYEKIDSAATSSLLAAMIPNIEASYASATGKGLVISSSDYIDRSEIGRLEHDPYLEKCYERFLSALKVNLNLGENLESQNPMIYGKVRISYLRLYEVRKLNSGGYRITQHLFTNGAWVVENILEGDTLPVIRVFSTWDGSTREIRRTSLEAQLQLTLFTSVNGRKQLEMGVPLEEITTEVNYKRVVEVQDNLIENW